MTLVSHRVILQHFNPLLQIKRFRAKINIQRPKPVHFERAKYIALTKPYYISPQKVKSSESCKKFTETKKKEIDNPFQKIIAGELNNWLNTSRLVAFYHVNPMTLDQQYKARVLFYRENMHLKIYGKKTLEIAVKGTKFTSLLDFYVSQNMIVFSPEPEIKKLLKITKRFPQLVLLAGIFEGTFISKDEILALSLIPNLQTAQASLLHTLNSATSTLLSQLSSPQATLVSQLQARVQQLEEK